MNSSRMATLARLATEMLQRLSGRQSTPIRPHAHTNSSRTVDGAAGGSRTHKSLQTMVFETIAVAISPPPPARGQMILDAIKIAHMFYICGRPKCNLLATRSGLRFADPDLVATYLREG